MMTSNISKAQDLKVLGQILHESIDELLLELKLHGQALPSLEQLNLEVLLAAPVGDGPRQRIARACEKLTTLVQGPMGVSTTLVYRIPELPGCGTERLVLLTVLTISPAVDDAIDWGLHIPSGSEHYPRAQATSSYFEGFESTDEPFGAGKEEWRL